MEFGQRVQSFGRIAAPTATTLFIALVSVVPFGIPGYGAVAPSLPLIALYYWAVHRPDLQPYSVCFGVGLFYDVLIGSPLGIHAFVFLVCQWLVVGQRRFVAGKSFVILWWGFVVVAVLAALLEWAAYSVALAHPMALEPVAFRALMLAAMFPLLGWGLVQIHRGMVHQEDA